MSQENTRLNEDFVRDTRSGKDRAEAFRDVQQPIGPDGFTNPLFDKFYGHNPFKGTERDRRNSKKGVTVEYPETIKCPLCGEPMFTYQKMCGPCWCKQGK